MLECITLWLQPTLRIVRDRSINRLYIVSKRVTRELSPVRKSWPRTQAEVSSRCIISGHNQQERHKQVQVPHATVTSFLADVQ